MLNLKNTLDGYLKNVEFIGNTVQDANNLANIRSVGDKVDGQELYNISIQVDNGEGVSEVVEILSPTQLEKVGDVADRIICKDGVWGIEKNIGNIVLTGSESWTKYITKGNVCSWILTMDLPFKADPWKNDNAISNYNINKYAVAHPSSDWTQYINTIAFVGGYHTINAKHVVAIFLDLSVNLKDKLSEKPMLLKYQTTQPQFIPLPHDQQVKLRTFAGQTNIVFNTEIAGQIKAQVPKSLGATVNTHTEQIADLHNSLDRVKKLEETTVSTVETESNFTTVDATSNGYFEDVKLEGKTLVNYSNVLVDTWTCPNGQKTNILNGFRATPSPTGSTTALRFESNITDLDMSNKTIKFKLNSSVTTSFIIQILDLNGQHIYDNNVQNVSNMDFITYIEAGQSVSKIRIYINRGSALTTSDYVDLFDIIILEGDHTNNPPEYFEGLLSVGQDVEEVSVESCFNVADIAIDGDTNFEVAHIKKGIPYSISVKRSADVGYNLVLRRNGKETILVGNSFSDFNTFTSNEDGVLFYNSHDKVAVSEIMLLPVLYSKDTMPKYKPYSPNKKPLLYYNPTTETWEKPILREWDSIEKHSDGKYYYHKRSEEVVLNGSENWGVRLNGDYVVGYMTKLNNMYFNQDTPFGFCDKFRVLPNSIWESLEDKIWNSAHQLQISIKNTKLSTQDVAGFKAWLKANPTTIVYRLVQEEVYECTNIDLMSYSGETNYIINSGAISPKSLLKVHSNIANVVKILQEKVSLLENTFIAGLKSVLSGDMYSLATILYPEDFEQNDNIEQDIMVIPE